MTGSVSAASQGAAHRSDADRGAGVRALAGPSSSMSASASSARLPAVSEPTVSAQKWQRRARPLLGTLIEVGLRTGSQALADTAFKAAFARLREVQAVLSRFDTDSDPSRFARLRVGESLRMRPDTRVVLGAAAELRGTTDALFDVTLGTAAHGWHCDGDRLVRVDAATSFDLGGIGKGHAVDRAVEALVEHGVEAGWVNAGGDLRSFGGVAVPVWLRDEASGGVRHFLSVEDGAVATSHFGPASASRLAVVRTATGAPARIHVSVAAPRCLWADALTKVVAASGQAQHPVLARHAATAWIH